MLYILEVDLDRPGGHESTLIKSFQEVSDGRCIRVIGPEGTEGGGDSDYVVHPILSSRSLRLSDPEAVVHTDAEKLAILLEEAPAHSLLVVPSSGRYVIRLLIELYRKHGFNGITRFRAMTPQHMEALNDTEQSCLRSLCAKGCIQIGTEFEETAEALRTNMRLPAEADFLLPCSIMPSSAFIERAAKTDGPVVVSFMGGLRREKGKYVFPKIVTALRKELARQRSEIQVEVQFQAHRRPKWSGSAIAFSIQFWCSLLPGWRHRDRVVLKPLTGIMSEEEYAATIRHSDLLLMPYEQKRYAQRGSGVLTDGVLAQTPIVCTRGIGGAEFRQDGNAIEATTPEEFALAIIEVANDPDAYLAGALRARTRMLARMRSLGFDQRKDFAR